MVARHIYIYIYIHPLLGIYPEKTMAQKNTCTPVFTVALFPTDKTWKQPKRLLTDDEKRGCGMHIMEYYSAINI